MNLQTELRRVREYLTSTNLPPSNEANTCNWIIWPLLLACGYAPYQIDAQGHNVAGGIPDYTILPQTQYTWFLEAKAWQVSITDTHVIQAINYAHTQGSRWVVLSNGREWRLYDDHIVGVGPPDRLVAVARLDCGTELEDLLAALSKESVQSGALEAYALKTRLATLLHQELTTSSSDVLKAITKVCKSKSGLSAVTSAHVAAYFHALSTGTAPSVPSAPTVSTSVPPPIQPASVSTPPPANIYTLSDLLAAGNTIDGKKPQALAFPDGTGKPVSTWRDVTLGIIEWLFTHGKPASLPFHGQKSGNQCFINTTPFHLNGAKMMHKPLAVNGQTMYINVQRSAQALVKYLTTLCQEVGEAPEGFRVTLQ